MEIPTTLPPAEESLTAMTKSARRAPVIDWYRSPIPKDEMKRLHTRTDWQGFIQTGGYLGILLTTGAASVAAWYLGAAWWIVGSLLFLHGMVTAFLINGVHELGHGTVFKTRRLNDLFASILAFLGWINHEQFNASHIRHHRYTLHPPDDLEVVLPIRLMIRHFLLTGFINPSAFIYTIKNTVRIVRGQFEGDWEHTLFPAEKPELARPTIRWARILLIGHALIAAAAIASGWWIIAVVVTLAPFYGGWLFFLCNNTQHIGLRDYVPDFRLCCRTFTLNPVARFLYWRMNYHTEHHMYAAVPCYNLGKLHKLIRHDLPPTPDGLVEVWQEIAAIQQRQEEDPAYIHPIHFPPTAAPARIGATAPQPA